jgi:hypothetical protein
LLGEPALVDQAHGMTNEVSFEAVSLYRMPRP